MNKKYTINFIKNEFEKRNYILLEKEYKNNHEKLKYKCLKCNNINYISYASFRKGSGCFKCAKKEQAERQTHSYDFIKSEFEKRNFKLLDNKYIKNNIPLKYRCLKCNSENNMIYNNLKKGRGCPVCSGNIKPTFECVKLEFEKRNFKLLETTYKNNKIKLKYKCLKCNNINYISYHNLKTGNCGCRKCADINRSNKNCNFWNPNREEVKLNEYLRRKTTRILKRSLKVINQDKKDKTKEILGYSNNELKNYIEKFPKWDLLKEQDWHLDHILPIKAFVNYGIDDLKIINHLSNLQPLDKEINLKKNCKYRRKDFHKYMKNFPEWVYDKSTFKYKRRQVC